MHIPTIPFTHKTDLEIIDDIHNIPEQTIIGDALAFKRLIQERDFLLKANEIGRKLIEEVIKGNSIHFVIQTASRLSGFPIIIHNMHGHPISYAGVDSLSNGLAPNVLFQYINNDVRNNHSLTPILQTINRQFESLLLLTQPIILSDKKMGYCSFILMDHSDSTKELAKMIIEKVSSVCSLNFLYEKTKLDSFEQMKGSFLQEIINGQFSSENEIIAKAGLLQFDLTKPYYLCMIGYSYNQYNFRNEMVFYQEVMSTISHYFSKQNEAFLMNYNDHHIQLFVTDHFLNNKEKYIFFKELIKFLYSQFPGSSFDLGVSNKKTSSIEAPNAFKEARASIRMITPNKQIVFFESLGMVGALINGNNEVDVRNMAKSILGNLETNCQKNIDLIRTLYSFLLKGGNLEKTAEELSLSISGLRYRINKIEELLEKDIRSPIIGSQLLMAIQGLILLGDIKIKETI